jgi:hypothetical protein
MPTQQNTSTSLGFNPGAEGVYNQLIGGAGNVMNGYINNPLGNPTYQLGLGQSIKGASQSGANNMNMLTQLMKTSGMGGSAGQGFLGAEQAQTGRANQSMLSNANLSNVMQAFQRQMQASGSAMSFSPQLAGSSGTSSQGGLGQFLPLIGGVAGSIFGGPAGGMAGGAAGSGLESLMGMSQPGGGMNINQLMQGGTSPFAGFLPGGSPGTSGMPNILSFMQPGQQ